MRPVSTPATQTAQAPVPQASVMPEPRSQVRIVTSLAALDLDDVDVDAARERRVVLEERADGFERNGSRHPRRRPPGAGCPSRRP